MMSYLLTLCFDCQSIWLILLQCGTKISRKENIGDYVRIFVLASKGNLGDFFLAFGRSNLVGLLALAM